MHLTITDTAEKTAAKMIVMIVALLAALGLAGTPSARADDIGYLAKLNESGVPIPVSDDVRLNSGRHICGQLRMRGISAPIKPEELVRQLTNTFFYSQEAAWVQIEAAQTELCPDTLPH